MLLGSFLMTLILHFLTSDPLKRTLILAKSLTSDPYKRGLLKRRKSVSTRSLVCKGMVYKFFFGPVLKVSERRLNGYGIAICLQEIYTRIEYKNILYTCSRVSWSARGQFLLALFFQ